MEIRLGRLFALTVESTGREDRIRTCDPHTPSVMRYQAALLPEQWRRAYRIAFASLQAR